VRRLCFDLSYLRLTQLKTGELCTLDEFVAAQQGQLDSVTERLQSFGTTTIATVDQACTAALDLLEQAGIRGLHSSTLQLNLSRF